MNYEITIELRDAEGKKNGAGLTLRRGHGGDGMVAVALARESSKTAKKDIVLGLVSIHELSLAVAAAETLAKGGA